MKAALLIAALTLCWLLWPLPRSHDWDIAVDAGRLAAKRAYLDALAASPAPNAGAPLNLVLIVADDLSRHDLSAYGHTPARTPAIDALAARGVRFLDAAAADPVCSPARAALLTGRHAQRFGFDSQPMQRYPRNRLEFLAFRHLIDTDAMTPIRASTYPPPTALLQQGLPVSETTVAEMAQALGYATGLFGKWHLGYGADNGPDAFGFARQYGFDEAFTLYAPDGAADIVEHRHAQFWERHIRDQGRTGPSAITRDGVEIAEDRYLTDAIADEAIAFIEASADAGTPFLAYVPFNAPHTPFQARREDFDAVTGARDHNERTYLAMIRRLDHAVGRIARTLDARGLTERTLVVFTSDNGGADYTGATDNGPLRAGKFTQFEGGLAVPLIVAGPGWPTGAVRDDPVSHLDLLPTIAAQLGVTTPADLDGVDLRAAPDADRPLFWRTDFSLAVRVGAWKLLRDRRDPQSLRLYDLATDPGEVTNLATREPQRAARLQALLDHWEAGLQAPAWPRVMNYRHCRDGDCMDFAI
ncbi:MAG TPA: sulfatase-like hydrolase/transferase [Pseudomonadales bacterium]|nr:sulfatase-like hydrolase/transferase [Pseudomonadales bacterium]